MFYPLFLHATLLLSVCRCCICFQHGSRGGRNSSFRINASPAVGGSESSFDLSSGLISQLAVAAIRSRLREHTSVKCEVSAKNNGLLLGSVVVGPATVKGVGWRSGLGLSCRAIEATVAECELDKRQVVTEKRLVLKQASFGDAMVAFNSNDFSNFLAHPLLRPPNLSSTGENGEPVSNLQFLREDVSIDPESKTLTFYVSTGDTSIQRWRCTLRRTKDASERANIQVSPTGDADEAALCAAHLSDLLSRYFNDLVFELDGCFLNISDLNFSRKGASPSILLKMSIRVEKFPSRNLAF